MRSINDIPQDLVDHFKPRLTEVFNDIADLNKRVENDPNLAQDDDFIDEASNTVQEIQNIAIEFMLAGGSEEDFMIIMEEAAKGLLPPPTPNP